MHVQYFFSFFVKESLLIGDRWKFNGWVYFMFSVKIISFFTKQRSSNRCNITYMFWNLSGVWLATEQYYFITKLYSWINVLPQSKNSHHLKLWYKHWVTDVTGYVGPKFIPLCSMYVQWIKETVTVKEISVNLYFVKQRENRSSISSPIDAFGHLVGYHRKILNWY